jgi:hypothetical protein
MQKFAGLFGVGAIITADALHCSRETAAAVVTRAADIVFTLKGNQGRLHAEAQALLATMGPAAPSAKTRDVLRQDKSKGSLAGKMKCAGWDNAFFLSLSAPMRKPRGPAVRDDNPLTHAHIATTSRQGTSCRPMLPSMRHSRRLMKFSLSDKPLRT